MDGPSSHVRSHKHGHNLAPEPSRPIILPTYSSLTHDALDDTPVTRQTAPKTKTHTVVAAEDKKQGFSGIDKTGILRKVSVKNPFVVADRQAKAKGIEPLTKTVHFAMPETLSGHRNPTSSQPVRSVERNSGQQATFRIKELEARGLEQPSGKLSGKERVDAALSTRKSGANESREMSSTNKRTEDIDPRTKASAVRGLNGF
ncbi:hypothetical protein B0T18DRAFT_245389 [Schizothecium vesticola]|uniref:Uncharacterized protein n=1 Tax=Schizothecium vesticola TaxID=314040 RepID=A0AA40EED1_9PEZI|nr:hypothetical protein B0T18DRAFT_245389 [Schizothecium vesticola]